MSQEPGHASNDFALRLPARSGAKIAVWYSDALLPEERQLIKVTALKNDLVVLDMKEATAAQAFRIAPLETGPVTALKNVFHNTRHGGPTELDFKQLSNGGATLQRVKRRSVVYCVECIRRFSSKSREGLNKSILDFQTCTESGACPDSVLKDQALARLIFGGPSMVRVASELVQRLPRYA